jgi:hypothetical protein
MCFACSKSFFIKRIITSKYCKLEIPPSISCGTSPVIYPSSLALNIKSVNMCATKLNSKGDKRSPCLKPFFVWKHLTTLLSVFSAQAKYRVDKIVRSSSEVVLRTTKHTMIYHGLGPSLEVIALHPVILGWRWTSVTRGEQSAREVCVLKVGNGSHTPYLKGWGPFMDRQGVCKLLFSYFTIQVKLHGQGGPRLGTSVCQAWIRMPDCLLGSRTLTRRVLTMVLRDAFASIAFSWSWSLPTCGLMWMG